MCEPFLKVHTDLYSMYVHMRHKMRSCMKKEIIPYLFMILLLLLSAKTNTSLRHNVYIAGRHAGPK